MKTLNIDNYLLNSKGVRHMADFINETMITDYEIHWTTYELVKGQKEINVVFKFTTFLGNVKIFHICHIPYHSGNLLIDSVNEFMKY